MDMSQYDGDGLTKATDEELSGALAFIDQEGKPLAAKSLDELTTKESEKLVEYASARDKIVAEQERRTTAAETLSAARSAFTVPADPEVPEGAPEGEPDGGEGGEGEDGGDAPEGDQPAEPESGQQLARRKLGTLPGPGKQTPGPDAMTLVGKTKVHGNVPGYIPGADLDSKSLRKAMLAMHKGTKNVRSGKFHVARVEFTYPEQRVLGAEAGDADKNVEKLALASATKVAQRGLTAAFCQPMQPIYDIEVVGVSRRPIRDGLSRFTSERGGIQYRAPFDGLSGLATAGMGIWTSADDDADPIVPKTCLEIECPGVLDAELYSTYLCLQYPNLTARFDEELVDAANAAALVTWARFAENELFKRMLAGSKRLTAPVQVSATRDILTNLDKLSAYYRNRHRLDDTIQMQWFAPRWIMDIMRADIARGHAGDLEALMVAEATIMAWLRSRNITPVWHLDGLDDGTYAEFDPDLVIATQQFYDNAAANAAIPDFITQAETVLAPVGEWNLLDGGTLDLGVVRDSTLNSQNRYQTFVETFEAPFFNGIESLRVVMDLEPTGLSVGTTLPPVSDVATLPMRTLVTPNA